MKKSIKYSLLLLLLALVNYTQIIKTLDTSATPAPTVNPLEVTSSSTAAARPKVKRGLSRAVAFELPTLQLTRGRKTAAANTATIAGAPVNTTVVEWGRPRRASSFSDLRELAESTQARPAPGVNRSVRVMLVPEPIDLSAQVAAASTISRSRSPRAHGAYGPLLDTDRVDSCAIEIGGVSTTTHEETPATAIVSTPVTDHTIAGASSREHDPLVLALAASLKVYTEQNSEFLRNQAEQNRVATEERNTTRRGVRDAKIIGAVATVGTLVGPYVAPYITAWVKGWI